MILKYYCHLSCSAGHPCSIGKANLHLPTTDRMHLAGSTVRGQQDAMYALYLLRHTCMYNVGVGSL